ncbi:conjugal transfer protein TraB [Acidithiobacillus thiooxidans]|uniref:Conjugal transfer protein TraB n=1 Tax=Acidithiobacillus thiooxidans TaxID=930 RepID=A0A1C2HXX6_ACITH|nr:conjugal transfer protein TraB [Acidithiobacillus thiooxidans]OCX79777.1 conjugal transfer protein TraB [Acidithiobacillus thiooxidans]
MKQATPLLTPFLIGAAIGWLAWPHAIWFAPVALVTVPVVAYRGWTGPFLLMLGYHLATTWGLIHGTAVFFPSAGLLLGLVFWAGSSLIFALPYGFYGPIFHWARSLIGSPCAGVLTTALLSAISTILPPLGIIGWTSPWLGAISEGWTGVMLVLLGIALAALGRKAALAGLVIGVGTAAALGAGSLVLAARHPAPAGWVGVNTRLGHLDSPLSYVEASMRLERSTMALLHKGVHMVLLPETVAGPWLVGTEDIWRPVVHWTADHPCQTVFVGTFVPHGRGYVDALVQIHDGRIRVLPDRIPVPFSMWHPWTPEGSFRMAPFSQRPEMTTVGALRVGYLICYEQLLMWPALNLALHRPQVLLAPANDWWARGTDIPAIQRASAKAWGTFLEVPVLFAVNR